LGHSCIFLLLLTRSILCSIFILEPIMVSEILEGVEISIETFFQKDYSNPLQNEYMFAYRITIENHNSFPIKLLRRYWEVFDSNSEQRIVEGEGVVGVQPLIMPGKNYQYVSGCHLKSELGKMEGYYTMENIENRELIKVNIPAFKLVAPVKLN
jgi:ApaG protein